MNDTYITGLGYKRWCEILSDTAVAPYDGLYVFACRGDMHLVFEMYMLHEGERLWKYFENEHIHYDGWVDVDPLAFHCIPIFSEENTKFWKAYENGPVKIGNVLPDSKILHVYALRTKTGEPAYSFVDDGVFSNLFCIPDMEISELKACDVVAEHIISRYTEEQHGEHWDLVKKYKKSHR